MHVTAVLTPAPEGGYSAYNSETGSVSEGETLESALENLKEVTGLFLEEFPAYEQTKLIVGPSKRGFFHRFSRE